MSGSASCEPRFVARSRSYRSLGNALSGRLNPRLDRQSLWGSNQANGDGRSARVADDGSYAVVCRVVASARDIEYRDLDIAPIVGGSAAVNLIYECLHISVNRDVSAGGGNPARRRVDDWNGDDRGAGSD
jgi:hypothetical protein